MTDNLVWFVWSIGLLLGWLAVFVFYRTARTRILWASLLTMLFGLSEPIFVPEYWNPPSLFDLAQKTGFDIESLIFCFAIGGMGIVIYDLLFKVKHEKMDWTERHDRHHRFHFGTLVSPFMVFALLFFLTGLNPIYSASLSMLAGGLAALWCRPDLKTKIWVSGVIFTLFYFVYFLPLVLFLPGFVERVWVLSAISGILIAGVPLEEFMFAFTFGMLWSSYYEHLAWYKIKMKSIHK